MTATSAAPRRPLAHLDLQPQQTAPLVLPRPRRSPENRRDDWRARLLEWIEQAQYLHQHAQICGCRDTICRQSCSDQPPVPELTDPLALESLLARHRPPILASTRPFPLLTYCAGNWLLPRAYCDLLTRAEEQARQLMVKASACSGCGAKDAGERSSGASGFVALCPACSQAR
ncbi:hypothetical protein ACWDQL_34370 [Streptomyces olivaceus]